MHVASPDQYCALFVYRQPFGFDNFVFEVFEILVIQIKTSLQGADTTPAAPVGAIQGLERGLHRRS
jgi:hypothetical protein